MNKINYYSISFRSINALSNVNLSTYSISAPIGKPDASLLTTTSISDKIFFMYKAVVSPSILGLKAKIISLNLSFEIRSIS